MTISQVGALDFNRKNSRVRFANKVLRVEEAAHQAGLLIFKRWRGGGTNASATIQGRIVFSTSGDSAMIGFAGRLDVSLSDVGKRYLPLLHVTVDIEKAFFGSDPRCRVLPGVSQESPETVESG